MDPTLMEELGVLLAEESIAKGAHVLLAPTINLHRNPLADGTLNVIQKTHISPEPSQQGTLMSPVTARGCDCETFRRQ